MTDPNSGKSQDDSRRQKGQIVRREPDRNNLPVDMSSLDLFSQALKELTEEEMRDLRKLVIEEKVKLESHKHKIAIDEQAARNDTQDHIDAWSVLANNNRHTERHTEESTIKTATGERRIVSKSGPGCFVATAVYGVDSRMVQWLRTYRDGALSRSDFGQRFINWYYRIGPGLAATVSRHRSLVWFSRVVISIMAAFAAVHWMLIRFQSRS
jgi:hypothetical protein